MVTVITDYLEDHRERMNTPCRQNAEFFNVMRVVCVVMTALEAVMMFRNRANEPAAYHPYAHKERNPGSCDRNGPEQIACTQK
jgi:hypothetical protein